MQDEIKNLASQLDQNRTTNEDIKKFQTEIVVYFRITLKFIRYFLFKTFRTA